MKTTRLLWPLLIVLAACTSMPPTPSSTAPPEAPAAAATPPASAAARVDGPESQTGSVETQQAIESTRRSVRSTAEWLARGIDSWFGDRPFEDGGAVTHGTMSVGLSKRQAEKAEFSLRFNARVRLPNLEQRAYLFIGRDNPREVVTDKPDALSNRNRLLSETAQDRSFFAGLGGYLSDSVDLRLGFRGVKPYAQARYRHGWEIGESSLIEFRETLFWTIKDRFGSTTALSWEHAYSSTVAARWLGAATTTQETKRLAWSSILGGYQSFGDRRVLALEALINGEEGSGVGASDYGLQTRWTQPLFGKRLLGEVLVGQFWPRKDALTERRRAWAVGGNLKMEF